MRFVLIILTSCFLIASTDAGALEHEYIQVTGDTVIIRLKPNTSSDIVAKAKKNDVFELSSEEGQERKNWYSILMFSGNWRYIHKSLASRTQFHPKKLTDVVGRKVFNALRKTESQSMDEADRKYPAPKDMDKNIDYQRVLIDGYKLNIFHRFNVQPPLYDEIRLEGIKKKWRN